MNQPNWIEQLNQTNWRHSVYWWNWFKFSFGFIHYWFKAEIGVNKLKANATEWIMKLNWVAARQAWMIEVGANSECWMSGKSMAERKISECNELITCWVV